MTDLMSDPTSTRVASLSAETTRVASGKASLAIYSSGVAAPGAAPIVFLHAGVCDSRMWAAQFATFAPSHRVVAYDRRGFGATAVVEEHFSSVDDLWAVLDTLAIERAVLVGCSQGGRIALDATLDRPERVAGLVLVAAAIGGSPEDSHPDSRLAALSAQYERAKAAGDVDEQNRIEAQVWLDGPFSPEGRVADSARELFLAMNHIVLTAPKGCSTTVPDTAYGRLAEVAPPTALIWGPLDVPSVIVNMRHAAATIPGAHVFELDGVAHLPSLEAPERFDAALATFLRTLPVH